MKLDIKKIRIDGGTQSRVAISEDTVMDYTEALLDGVQMFPVIVFFDGKEYWLADGFHRYHAHARAKLKEMDCEIKNGTKRDAKIFSWSANAKHGLRRSNADKRKIVIEALEDIELAGEDARTIAKLCAVSPTQVFRIKNSLNIDRKVPRPMTEYVELEVPDAVEEEDKLEELATENVALAEENQRLKDKLAIKKMEADPQAKAEIEETIESLRSEVSTLESQLKAMTISRNDYQKKAADALEQLKYWKRRAEKAEKK
jgi:ParB-like chromosome segregation protein Spo0J